MTFQTKSQRSLVKGLGAALAATTAFSLQLAFAQEDIAVASANGDEEARLGVIIVQARKREESILEIPASVAVIDSASIARQGVQDFEDLARAVPNVRIGENSNIAGRSGVTIRGIPGRAGIYVDDVFVGDAAGINTVLVDVEAVEVLRGPQGTLFGRNAMSGAINTITRKPSEDFSAYLDVEGGEYDLLVARGAVNGPIAEGISGKITAGYRQRDSYDEVVDLGRLQAEDALLIGGQLRFQPTEALDIIFNVDYLDETSENAGSDAVRDFGVNGMVYGVAATDASPTDRVHPAQNVTNTADREMTNLWGRVEYDFGFATFTSITNQRDIEFLFTRDGDSSDFDYIRGLQPVDFEQFSQEFRLTSAGDGDFDWMLGFYYYDDERSDEDANTIGGDALLTVNPGFAPFSPPLFDGGVAGVVTPNILVANPAIGGFDPTLGFILSLLQAQGNTDVGTTTNFTTATNESTAFWATGTWRPAEQWELTGGLRFTDETQGGSFEAITEGQILPLFGVVATPEIVLPDRSDDNLSVNGSVSYFASDDLTLYGAYAEGFRSGGYNLAPGGVPLSPEEEANSRAFDSEIVTSYEIGAKSFFLDGRLNVNGAYFYSTYEDFQRSFLRATPAGFVNETLNTDATIWGIEIDAAFQVNDRLFITASYGHQDSEYDDYQNAPINSTEGLEVVDLTGAELPGVPNDSYAIGIQYEAPVFGDWNAQITTDIQSQSSFFVTDSLGRDPETKVDEITIVNPSIGLTNDDLGVKVILRANNLFDETFTTGLDFNSFDGAVTRTISAPRVVSLQVRKDF